MTNLRDYLQQSADNWAKLGHPALMERFILRNGTEYAGRKLPRGYRPGTPKECYYNATRLAENRKLTYVEGFVWRNDLPLAIQHAWCIDAKGKVIDVTLRDPQDCQYMGVPVEYGLLWKELMKSGVYGLLDHGRGLNVDFMFKTDPDLKAEVEAVMAGGGVFKRRVA